MHPIHNFPIELLAQVFRTGAAMTLQEWKDRSSNTIPPLPLPMVICAVCQHWRQVALSAPDLWSTIYVPLIFSNSPPRSLIYDAVKFTTIWLARSQEAPLDVCLRVPNVRLAYDLSNDLLLPTILQHAHRLRKLIVLGNASELIFPNVRGIVSLIATGVGSRDTPVEVLALKFQGRGTARITDVQTLLDRDWDVSLDNPPIFSTKYLSIEGIRFNPSFFPHLVSLTVVHLETTLQDFQNIFTSLPLLESLSLPQLHVVATRGGNEDPFIVSSLRSLSLSFHRRPLSSLSLYPVTRLNLPNLRSLTLDGQGNVPICSCLDLSFISSLNNLDHLTLRNFVRFSLDSSSGSTESDIRLLHSLTSIRYLQLIRSPTGNLLSPHSSTDHPPSSFIRPRKRSFGNPVALSPQLSETGRALEGALQMLRVNGTGGGPTAVTDNLDNTPLASLPPSTGLNWPVLEMISMDTLVAVDLVNLCNYVSHNPNVKLVHLSGLAQRHLSHGVRRRISNNTFYFTNFFTKKDEWDALKAKDEDPSADVESAADWLGRRVQILPFEDFDQE